MLLAASLVLWGCDEGLTKTENMQGTPQASTERDQSASQAADVYSGAASAASANQQAELSNEKKALNKQLRAVSRALAKALAGEEARQYVHSRIMERFDGETNVLWQDLESMNGSNALEDTRWNALIKNHLAPPGKAGEMSQKEVKSTIERAGQLMSGPVHLYWAYADNLKASDLRDPLVTFTPLGIDPDEITDVVAFDAQGERHVVNEAVARKRPVVALTGNERTDAQGNVLERYARAPNRICAPGEEPPGCEPPPPPPPPPPCEPDCGDDDPHTIEIPDRSPGDTQYLYDTRLHKDVEGWLKGEPEIKVALRDSDGGSIEIDNNELNHHENCCSWDEWRDRTLFDWEPDEEGFYVTFDWHEDDGDSGDDDLGSATVNYGASSTKHYFGHHDGDRIFEWTLHWD